MPVTWLSREQLDAHAASMIRPVQVVLDIGTGLRPQTLVRPTVHICCEPFDDYIATLQQHFADFPGLVILKNTAQAVLAQLPDKSIDSVFLLDVIEHIDKDEGKLLLHDLERVTREQIVIFTPLGFMEQEYEAGDTDGWGYGGGIWQKHRSGWTEEDFDDSWHVLACDAYHLVNGKGEPFDPPFGALWAIKDLRPAAAEVPRFVFYSRLLPPGGTPVLEKLDAALRPLPRYSFILVSHNQYDHYSATTLADDARLPASYVSLEPVTEDRVRRHWLVKLLAIPSRWAPFGKLVRRFLNGYLTYRNRVEQLVRIAEEDGSAALVAVGGDTFSLSVAHRASRRLGIPLIAITHADLDPGPQGWRRSVARITNWLPLRASEKVNAESAAALTETLTATLHRTTGAKR